MGKFTFGKGAANKRKSTDIQSLQSTSAVKSAVSAPPSSRNFHAIAKQKRRKQRKADRAQYQERLVTSGTVSAAAASEAKPDFEVEHTNIHACNRSDSESLHLNLLESAFIEWTVMMHSLGLSSHDCWHRFLVDWSSVSEYSLPINSHRPDTLFTYVKSLRQSSNLHVARQRCKRDRARITLKGDWTKAEEANHNMTMLQLYINQQAEERSMIGGHSQHKSLLKSRQQVEEEQQQQQQQQQSSAIQTTDSEPHTQLQLQQFASSNPFDLLQSVVHVKRPKPFSGKHRPTK